MDADGAFVAAAEAPSIGMSSAARIKPRSIGCDLAGAANRHAVECAGPHGYLLMLCGERRCLRGASQIRHKPYFLTKGHRTCGHL